MTKEEIKEGDIVEIEYITEFTKEHINEGKALVIWKGFNHQPLVRKLNTKTTVWTCYEHIARVVGHIDIEGYMDKALEQQPYEDCIRELIREFDNKHPALFADYMREFNNHPISEIIEYMWDMHDLIEDIKYRLPNEGGEEE